MNLGTKLVLCLSIFWAIHIPVSARSATLRVPSAYPTIDSGILAAQAGDTVLVAPGVYTGPGNRNIRMYGKPIVVTSEEGPEQTIIDVQASFIAPARGFIIDGSETPESILDGFTVINGLMSTQPQRDWSKPRFDTRNLLDHVSGAYTGRSELHDLSGGGIRVTFQSHPTIRNLIVRNCHSEVTGGGIAIEIDSAPTLIGCVIQDCTAAIQGGGLSIEFGAKPRIERCLITGNRAPLGGGVANDANPFSGFPPHFVDCTIASNYADDRGGGIFCFEASKTRFERVVVWGNCAAQQGPEVLVEPFAQTSFACSVIDSSEIHNEGTLEFAQDNVFHIPPGFCMPDSCSSAPSDLGDYSVGDASPCLSENSPCALQIGGMGPGVCATPDPVIDSGWGRLKSVLGKQR
jgi:hypothetical protein